MLECYHWVLQLLRCSGEGNLVLLSLFWLSVVSVAVIFSARGVSYLFDIQVKTFNSVYDGEDVIAQARTGTGKTFSFAIPLVEKLQNNAVENIRGRPPKVHFYTKNYLCHTQELHQSESQFLFTWENGCVWLNLLFVGPGVNSNQRVGYPGCQGLQRHY